MSRDKKRIPQLTEVGHSRLLAPLESKTLIGKDANQNPYVSLKYYNSAYQCFSEWSKDELKDFTSFLNNLKDSNWNDIFQSGGSLGQKKGFGQTYHSNPSVVPGYIKISNSISEDIRLFELRVSKQARVHGFRAASAFFLICLDRGHDIYP